MRITFTLAAAGVLLLTSWLLGCTEEPQPPPAAATLDDPWALPEVPADEQLASGRLSFEFCASCHLADGGGRPDGSIPRLAGQHASILEHKLLRIRSGEVHLPAMKPFARALETDEIPTIAAYLAALPEPTRRERGTEPDAAAARAAAPLYQERCAACHGTSGEGNTTLLAPRLCGQHPPYLERRLSEMKDAPRGGTDPAMLVMASLLSEVERAGLAAHIGETQCAAPGETP